MNPKKLLMFIILSLMFLFSVNVFAAEPPGLPHVFYGKVYLSDGSTPAPPGLVLVAKINDVEYGSTTTSDGKYDYLIVTDPENTNEGETIYFYVDGIQASPTYEFENRGFTGLDLTLTAPLPTTVPTTTPPSGRGGGGRAAAVTTITTTVLPSTYCDNGICEAGETCYNCPEDCGPCPEEIEIDIIDIIIPPVTANEPFDIEVIVKNVGDVGGYDDITVDIPEGWSTNIWGVRVTLNPGETKKLYFTITPDENSGEITVGSSTDFEISETITPIVPEKPKPLGITGMFLTALASLGYWWIPSIIIVVLVIIYLARRKPSRKKPYEYKHKRKKR